MSRLSKLIPVVVLSGLAVGALVGCPDVIPIGYNLTYHNISDADADITAGYIRPSDDKSWGANQIQEPVLPGETYTVTGIQDGVYDLRAEMSTPGGAAVAASAVRFNVPISEGSWRWFLQAIALTEDEYGVVDDIAVQDALNLVVN